MKSYKTVSFFILVSLMLSASACGYSDAQIDTADDKPSESDTTAVEADPLLPSDTKDYGGREFTIVTTDILKYNYADEMNGNAVNDAIYERDRKTEEELGIKINYHIAGPKINDVFPAVQASVMAGDSDYDLIISHVNWELTAYVTENLVVDWNTVPHVDFSKPYWNSDIINTLSVSGKSPYAASDIFMGNTVFLLYNKDLSQSLGLGSLYDYVYDGTWTWDKLIEISAEIKSDINGDSKFDELDRYGIAMSVADSSWMLRNIPSSCGLFVYSNGSDGLKLTVNNEKTQTILEKITGLFKDGGGYLIEGSTQDISLQVAAFNQGTYLTWLVATDKASSYNNLGFDYGVLPLPKYDEAQENYLSLSWNNNLMVPATADADFSGMVSEWMSYYGNKLVRPEFYDSMMSVRFAQDAETVDMLDIIFNNIVYDPGMNFKSNGFYAYFDSMVKSGNADFASYYQSNLAAEEAYIKNLNESFKNFGK